MREDISQGLRDTRAAAIGLIPLGLAFGLLMVQSGFSWWWTPIFSIVIYAGSMEFLAISMVTGGATAVASLVTGFMVNFRHIFYGLTFPRHRINSRLGRAYSTYALTDETYAIVSSLPTDDRPTGARTLTIQIFLSGPVGRWWYCRCSRRPDDSLYRAGHGIRPGGALRRAGDGFLPQ